MPSINLNRVVATQALHLSAGGSDSNATQKNPAIQLLNVLITVKSSGA